MCQNITGPLAEFNKIYKTIDGVYHLYAKSLGISDTRMWLLYSMYAADKAYTQRELCSEWNYPPQTLNSALKEMEKQGIISLEHSPGNMKNKRIILTEQGREYTQKMIAPLVLAEQRALEAMPEDERSALLSLMAKHAGILQREVGGIGQKIN